MGGDELIASLSLAACGPCPPTSLDPTHPTFLRTPPDLPYSIIEAMLTIPIIIHSRSSAPSISRRSCEGGLKIVWLDVSEKHPMEQDKEVGGFGVGYGAACLSSM
jgi:hypothetical protein